MIHSDARRIVMPDFSIVIPDLSVIIPDLSVVMPDSIGHPSHIV